MSNQSQALTSSNILQARIAEYQAGTSAYLNADNYPWQVGAVLLVAASIVWGSVLSNGLDALRSSAALTLVTLVFSIWYLYANHNRQIYRFMLQTLVEIESQLQIDFNLRFWQKDQLDKLQIQPPHWYYHLPFPRGHQLNLAFYIVGSIGGPCIVYALTSSFWPLLLSGGITLMTIVIALISNRRSDSQKRNETTSLSRAYNMSNNHCDLISAFRENYSVYHHHKEQMAYTATALYLAGSATLLIQQPALWSNFPAPAVLFVVLSLTAILAFVFVGWQLKMRLFAADIVVACDNLLGKWMTTSPSAVDLEMKVYQRRGRPNREFPSALKDELRKLDNQRKWLQGPINAELFTYSVMLISTFLVIWRAIH